MRFVGGATVLVAILAAAAAVRLRLAEMPLDRDEGEYAYMAQLLLEGVAPYAQAYNMKMPGIYAAYAVVLSVFGHSPAGIRLGLVLVTTVSTTLLYLLARRLFGAIVALVAAALYAVLVLCPQTLGLAAYAEHFVLLAVLSGLLVLEAAVRTGRPGLFVIAGLAFGLAFVLKQSGGIFAPFAAIATLVALRGAGPRRVAGALGALGLGALIPFATVCLTLALAGTFSTFWFWTVRYAPHYAAAVPLGTGLTVLVHRMTEAASTTWPIWLAALIGLEALVHPPARRHAPVLAAFAIFSILAVSPGLHFRHHYFLLLAPAVAVLAALGLTRLAAWLGPKSPIPVLAALASLAIASTLWLDRVILFQSDPAGASRALYDTNPFIESVEIARYIRERTSPEERIFVVGSEPQIYFYARRRSASGYIYMYPLMERHPHVAAMQRQLFAELGAARPTYLVFVGGAASWLAGPDSDTGVAEWFRGYWRDFEPEGIIEIRNPGGTQYHWGAAAQRVPATSVWLGVYRRRTVVPGAGPPASSSRR